MLWLLDYGGKNISHFFDENSYPLMDEYDQPNLLAKGHLSKSEYGIQYGLFWWNDLVYKIGALTRLARNVKIVEAATGGTAPVFWSYI